MIEKAKKLAGKCSACGKVHPLVTAEVYVGPDATEKLAAYIGDRGSRCVVVCDENTEKYARVIAEGAGCTVFTLTAGSHATEITTGKLLEFCADKETELFIACGSGSIHDTVRYCANEKNLPFVSYPTAASVDGFVSSVAAMTWYGQKLTVPAGPPVALFADDRVYAYAPARLTASGAADILGKYTALADWRTAQIVTGEHLCENIYNLEKEALDATAYAILHRSEYDDVAYTRLIMDGLILSGLAMQLQENSRPASGSEHHMSHFWEMHLINKESDGYHGEQVGVGLLCVLEMYKAFARRDVLLTDSFLHPNMDAVLERDRLCGVYGELTDGILAENLPASGCSLTHISVQDRVEAEKRLRAVLAELPEAEEVRNMLRLCGAPASLAELDLPDDEAFIARCAAFAPYARNRLTLLKLIEAERLCK